MKEGLPSIMVLKPNPFVSCPLEPELKCNCYKLTPCPDCLVESVESDKGGI